jgi:hypothetical protein
MSRSIILFISLSFGIFCLTEPLRAQRITAVWQGQQLGTVLERLVATRSASLWLDRRVDPRQMVDIQFTEVLFTKALADLAEQHDLGVALLDSVFYVGPKKTAAGLATLSRRARADLARTPASRRQRWLRAEASAWPRLTQPRALLKELLEQSGVEVFDSELVPHDLWQARELPKMALVDRVVLVLAGFDLTCEISRDGKTCRVVPIDFPLPTAGAAPLAEASSPTRSPVRSGAKAALQQFSLRLENQPVGRVMEQLAAKLKLKVSWDEESLRAKGRSRETMVSCQVTNVELDELLRGILEPAGLGFTKVGQREEIFALP